MCLSSRLCVCGLVSLCMGLMVFLRVPVCGFTGFVGLRVRLIIVYIVCIRFIVLYLYVFARGRLCLHEAELICVCVSVYIRVYLCT